MKKDNTYAHITLALLIIFLCFYLSWVLLIPQYKADKSTLAQVKSDVDLAKEKLDSLELAKVSIDELGDLVDKTLIAVPADSDKPNLLAELEALAAKHQIVLPTIQVSDPATGSNIVGVAFSVNGSFETISQLISSIEKDIRFMNIKSVSLSASAGAMSASFQIETYRRPENSLSATATSSAASVNLNNLNIVTE